MSAMEGASICCIYLGKGAWCIRIFLAYIIAIYKNPYYFPIAVWAERVQVKITLIAFFSWKINIWSILYLIYVDNIKDNMKPMHI